VRAVPERDRRQRRRVFWRITPRALTDALGAGKPADFSVTSCGAANKQIRIGSKPHIDSEDCLRAP
jgi:hypothetical protein